MTDITGFAQSGVVSNYSSLVLVCCHGTYLGDGNNTAEDQWILQPFQRSDALKGKPSESETFTQHIITAALVAHGDPHALLIFSGGRTTTAPRSEAEGYAAILSHVVNQNPILFPGGVRFGTETSATDSYQNLLFSIIRFRQLTGAYPDRITIITHAFKERRFLELHAPAIKWPTHRVRVLGLNPPFPLDELKSTQHGEHERAYRFFAEDPFGVRMPLRQKRLERNWDPDVPLGWSLEPAVMALLEWQGGTSGMERCPHRLPWEDAKIEHPMT